MPRGERTRPGARGFTYVGLLVLVVLLGLLLSAAGQVASTTARRDREAQLLWVGHEYRAAIQRYVVQRRAYPKRLEELLGGEPDAPLQVRYLRRLYPDPMTNAVDWVLLPAPGGGIRGVASSSGRAPLKTGGFEDFELDFADASTYGDWQFTFPPGRAPAQANPAQANNPAQAGPVQGSRPAVDPLSPHPLTRSPRSP